MSLAKTQLYRRHPIEVRETSHYTHEYVHEFVQKWDELIDWDKRAQTEGDFFIELLRRRGAARPGCGNGHWLSLASPAQSGL